MQADARRQEIRERWTRFFDSYDIVLMPVSPTAAPPHHGKVLDKFGRAFTVDGHPRPYWDQVKWCGIANIAGTPATTIPTGLGAASGLPIGIQAMGPAGGDLTTIEFAALLGERLGGFRRPS
jgi:amidase